MDLTILGCHGGESRVHRCTSFLVDGRLAIDAGALCSSLSPREQQAIEVVVVSHPHLDHVKDLGLIADTRCQQGGPPLTICGLPSTLRALKKHFFNDVLWPDFTKIDCGEGPTIRYQRLNADKVSDVLGYRIEPVRVSHTVDTAGFLVDDGDAVLAYSGDTGPTESLWKRLAKETRLSALLLEVSFPNELERLSRASGHLTPALMDADLNKMKGHEDLPILVHHIKPVVQKQVHRELAKVRKRDLHILELDDEYVLRP